MLVVFQPIFGKLSISSTATISKAVVWIEPYDPTLDLLALLNNKYTSSFVWTSVNGVLTITSTLTSPTINDWVDALKYPSYRFNVPVRKNPVEFHVMMT